MSEGLQLAVIGVAVVFAFLAALVLSVHLLGWFFRTWGHLFEGGDDSGRRGPPGLDTARVAAAVAAVEAYRKRNMSGTRR